MAYNPAIHNRKAMRLKWHDYSKPGAYFVTICAKNRKCLFGDVKGCEVELSAIGMIAEERWKEIPQHYAEVQLDSFRIMPNHIHGIIIIKENCRDRARRLPTTHVGA
jgi:putative transposase